MATLDPLGFEHVGKLAYFGVQFAIGDLAIFGRVVPFPDDGDLVAALAQMAIPAVG